MMSGAEKTEEESEAWQAVTADRINSSRASLAGRTQLLGRERERESFLNSQLALLSHLSGLYTTRPDQLPQVALVMLQ